MAKLCFYYIHLFIFWYLGGCTITSKSKINVFWNFFSHRRPLQSSSVQFFFSKNIDFSLWDKQCILLRKWVFFHSLWNGRKWTDFRKFLRFLKNQNKHIYEKIFTMQDNIGELGTTFLNLWRTLMFCMVFIQFLRYILYTSLIYRHANWLQKSTVLHTVSNLVQITIFY